MILAKVDNLRNSGRIKNYVELWLWQQPPEETNKNGSEGRGPKGEVADS